MIWQRRILVSISVAKLLAMPLRKRLKTIRKTLFQPLKEDRVVMGAPSLMRSPLSIKMKFSTRLHRSSLNNLQRQGATLDMFFATRGIKTDDFIKDLQEQADERARQSLCLMRLFATRTSKPPMMMSGAEFEKAGVKMSKRLSRSEKGRPSSRHT